MPSATARSRPNVHTYRYGEARGLPGLAIGVTRYPPRGVRREDYASAGYFDVWLPLLAPSAALLASFRSERISFALFSRRYRAEMRRPDPRHSIGLLAAVARRQRINLGCACADPSLCHRTLLHGLIEDASSRARSKE